MTQQYETQLSTGLPGLDHMLNRIIPGDNLVWQVNSVGDYQVFAEPFCRFARTSGKTLVYFRFARHERLMGADQEAEVHELHPEKGFEPFINDIHRVVKEHGRDGYYLFDCLSDLAEYWYSDRMLGNFFMLTCPYILDMEGIAYFGLYRNYHSAHAIGPLRQTTQVFLDVYRHRGKVYLHPLKVQQRYSPSMDMLHVWKSEEEFPPVTDSVTVSEVFTSVPWNRLRTTGQELGIWNRTILQGEELLAAQKKGEARSEQEAGELLQRLIRMAITRDSRVSQLVAKYLSLEDILTIGKRVIGTGLIGGKSVGMLLARAILEKTEARWGELFEPHDSFFVGSDVFYTFLVRNNIWWEREKQKNPETLLEGSQRSRQRILVGVFPDYIEEQFSNILDYFGQSPFIVRSSSLLEDNFGNAFAGKYESVYCVNQGPRDKRLEDFKSAVRTIYASAMSEKALTYRAQRGLLGHDEQMALLIQRVSGAFHDTLYFPQIAGVGFSYNPYVWGDTIDPEAGVMRLVLGLGTRAVDRSDDDYTRVVALNAPQRRPEATQDDSRRYSQKKVDVLDLQANHLVSWSFEEVIRHSTALPLELFASRDTAAERYGTGGTTGGDSLWILTFDRLLTQTDFVRDMREMLRILQDAYNYPVDIEFTCNFFADGTYKINLLQCRPFQVKGDVSHPEPPHEVAQADLILQSQGAVIGQSRICEVDRFVYVVPSHYAQLPIRDRYMVARTIGKLMHVEAFYRSKTIMLLGPGRWGTTTPSLGVPISFSDINTVSILCEIVRMSADLIPDVSLGTHLFSELVEMDILYMALFPERAKNLLNERFFEGNSNALLKYLPEAETWAKVIRVIEADGDVRFYANALSQQVVCYHERQNRK